MGTSYGLIEIPSTTAAIDVLDIMCKTADVEFVTWEKKLGGRLVTIVVQGTISAVTEAVEAAASLQISNWDYDNQPGRNSNHCSRYRHEGSRNRCGICRPF